MRRRAPRLASLILLPAILLLLYPAWQNIASWRAMRGYPVELDAEEGFLLNQALTLGAGGSIYHSVEGPPFLAGNYPPLYPWLYGVLHRALIGADATARSLDVGRGIAQGAAVLAALALGLCVWRGTRNALAALLGALLLFSTWETGWWGHFARVDLLALALTLTGMGCVLGRRLSERGIVAGALLFVGAGFTRQTAVAAPLAVAIALAIADRRRCLLFVGVYAGTGFGLLALAQMATHGEFWRHTVTYNANALHWPGFRAVMRNEVWFFHRWLIMAAGTGIFSVFPRGQQSAGKPAHSTRFRVGVVGLYCVLSSLTLIGYAKIGAGPNYVLEPAASWGLAAACAAGWGLRRWRSDKRILVVLVALLTLHGGRLALPMPVRTIAGWRLSYAIRGAQHSMRMQSAADLADLARMAGEAHAAPGDIYSELPAIALLARKPVLFQPFIMSRLAREGKWDEGPFVGMLAGRRFSMLILADDVAALANGAGTERLTPAMAAAIKDNYTLSDGPVALAGGFRCWTWLPKPAPLP